MKTDTKKSSDFVILMEIVSRIRKQNEGKGSEPEPIPLSDTIYKHLLADICESRDKMFYYLRLLSESHYIFVISLIEEDESHNMGGVYGYVVAEPLIVDSLKESSAYGLEAAYEQQFYKRKPCEGIIRELLPQAKIYNNTPLGRALNMAVMLQQFAKILRVDYEEYTEVWKRSKLLELLPELKKADFEQSESEDEAVDTEPDTAASAPSQEEEQKEDSTEEQERRKVQRAVDTKEMEEIQKMDKSGQWGRAVDKYGTEFLIRIHLRKHEFDRLRWLMRTNRIAKESDLRYIRDSVRKMEGRLSLDAKLKKFQREMLEVKRIAQIKLNAIYQIKKKLQAT